MKEQKRKQQQAHAELWKNKKEEETLDVHLAELKVEN